ncbi:MAG: DNA cytosine methyltransferase [Patescibacteria group bacterium]|nr:DNA cytosine methyltransferase [Patescibacteria group bacterium]
MNELHLFAGAGGGILGGILLGHTCVCAVELEPACRRYLLQRQRDGILPRFPIWDDVKTFDGRPWRGLVDVVAGGFPCKGISVAGSGTGLDHEESGLWREQARIIGEVRPPIAFVENSPALTIRGGLRVIGDLAALGYDCRWGIVSAADAIWSFGTPCLDHERARIWIYAERADANRDGQLQPKRSEPKERRRAGDRNQADADSNGQRRRKGIADDYARESDVGWSREVTARSNANGFRRASSRAQGFQRGLSETAAGNSGKPARVGTSADTHNAGREEQRQPVPARAGRAERDSWWAAEPGVGRMAHGVAGRVDRLKAIGNGQVPAVVELAWQILKP